MMTDAHLPSPGRDDGILLADLGGTHARFAFADRQGGHGPPIVLRVAEFQRLQDAVRHALGGAVPARAYVAMAGPVTGGVGRMTNNPWGEISAAGLRGLGLGEVTLLNDLEAQAWLLPHARGEAVLALGGGKGLAGAPMLLVSPGTGLGVALHVPGHGAIATEAGHVSLAGANAREDAVLARLRERFGHASAERALCGAGFAHLATALAEMGDDPAGAADMFMALLAGFCGNAALATGARGGVFLSGNILNARQAALLTPGFHRRFTEKGRFQGWLQALPLRLITLSEPGLAGLAWRAAYKA